MEVIRIAELVDAAPVLAGARSGAALFTKLAALLPPPRSSPEPLLLDFDGVELASASFLRESIFPFKAFTRTARSAWYPVIANSSPDTLDELEVVCSARADSILVCVLSSKMKLSKVSLIGRLDGKQQDAYNFVVSSGGATAKTLMEATATPADASISPTAWNNRLSALVEKGVVAEVSAGRQKFYTPLVRCS